MQVDQKSAASSTTSQPLAAITSGSIDDLFSTGAVSTKKAVSAVPPPPAEDSVQQGEWIEAFDKKR